MSTALEMSMRINLRRRRADALVAAVMKEIRYHLVDRDAEAEVARALRHVFYQEGIEILSDYTRAEIGLPPRGPDGWTLEEMHALERARLDAIMRPSQMVIPAPTWDEIQRQKAAARPDEGTGG
jgi:hypothetical protein